MLLQSQTSGHLAETFQGQGDSVVGPFALQQGVATLSAFHAGSGSFIVTIIGQGTQKLAINQIGQYEGEAGFSVHADDSFGLIPGDYRLEVKADGGWSIRLHQEYPSDGEAPPITAQGRGDRILKWVQLSEGTFLVRAAHYGEDNFVVELLHSDGSGSTLLVNEVGGYSGESSVQISSDVSADLTPGPSALLIRADGGWEISFEQ